MNVKRPMACHQPLFYLVIAQGEGRGGGWGGDTNSLILNNPPGQETVIEIMPPTSQSNSLWKKRVIMSKVTDSTSSHPQDANERPRFPGASSGQAVPALLSDLLWAGESFFLFFEF